MRFGDHPPQQWQKLIRILHGAAEADQQPVLMGITAQSGAAAFDPVGELQMIQRSASPTEAGRQQLMAAPFACSIPGTPPREQQFGGHHPRRPDGEPLQQGQGHQCCSPGMAISVQAFSGCSWLIRSA